ncbi:MAG: 4Fe-4S binding protein [Bdellovibrionota bacterium]
MAFVIAEPCIGKKHHVCVEVCPVNCIYGDPESDQFFIHPKQCIDCGICEFVCPENAIFDEPNLPEKWKSFAEKNANYFKAPEDDNE